MPENELPCVVGVTAWLYQPFESGGRDGVTVAVGEEVSTSNGKLMSCVVGPHHT